MRTKNELYQEALRTVAARRQMARARTGFPGYGLGAKLDIKNGKPLPQGKELSRGFMLRYGNYCHYFPMVALAKGIGV